MRNLNLALLLAVAAAGGPFKPFFGLSGAVSSLDKVSLPPVLASAQSTRIQSPLCLLQPVAYWRKLLHSQSSARAA